MRTFALAAQVLRHVFGDLNRDAVSVPGRTKMNCDCMAALMPCVRVDLHGEPRSVQLDYQLVVLWTVHLVVDRRRLDDHLRHIRLIDTCTNRLTPHGRNVSATQALAAYDAASRRWSSSDCVSASAGAYPSAAKSSRAPVSGSSAAASPRALRQRPCPRSA